MCEEGAECESDEFKCDVGQCVPEHWYCDGEEHCEDGSDEKHHSQYFPTTSGNAQTCISDMAGGYSMEGYVKVFVCPTETFVFLNISLIISYHVYHLYKIVYDFPYKHTLSTHIRPLPSAVLGPALARMS